MSCEVHCTFSPQVCFWGSGIVRVLCLFLRIVLVNGVWKLHLWVCGFEKFAHLRFSHLVPAFAVVNSPKFAFAIDEVVRGPVAVAVSTPNGIVVVLNYRVFNT